MARHPKYYFCTPNSCHVIHLLPSRFHLPAFQNFPNKVTHVISCFTHPICVLQLKHLPWYPNIIWQVIVFTKVSCIISHQFLVFFEDSNFFTKRISSPREIYDFYHHEKQSWYAFWILNFHQTNFLTLRNLRFFSSRKTILVCLLDSKSDLTVIQL